MSQTEPRHTDGTHVSLICAAIARLAKRASSASRASSRPTPAWLLSGVVSTPGPDIHTNKPVHFHEGQWSRAETTQPREALKAGQGGVEQDYAHRPS